jgi:4-methyl-5(b-hydroxyethyl)-thiazole monophosphate biosynthesis
MPGVAVLFAEGFEEIEAITIVDVLRRAEVDVTTVGVGGTEIRGSHGVTVAADIELEAAAGRDWEMVILPGGMPGSTNLRDDPGVQALIGAQCERGRRIGAICAAPIALGAAGILEGKRATSYPGFEDQLRGARYSEERVVRDGPIITSRGPGTAMEFALEIVSDLKGRKVADQLRKGMLVG